jgi:large subunit ribosomal protein L17
MKKRIKTYKFRGKKSAHRNAVIKSQVIELIRNQKIKTTPIKAKALKASFDKLVTQAKKDTIASKSKVRTFFNSNERAIDRFYKIVEAKLSDRNSGYTRLIKTTPRAGDNAEQTFVVLVNYEPKEKKSKIKSVLEKREKQKEEKSIGSRIKRAVGVEKQETKAKQSGPKVDKSAKRKKTRRISM